MEIHVIPLVQICPHESELSFLNTHPSLVIKGEVQQASFATAINIRRWHWTKFVASLARMEPGSAYIHPTQTQCVPSCLLKKAKCKQCKHTEQQYDLFMVNSAFIVLSTHYIS